MSKPIPFTQEIAKQFGIIWINPWVLPNLPDKGLSGVCEWYPGVAKANIGLTNLTVGQVFALPYDGKPQLAIKERHPQDEVFIVFGRLVLGLSETMNETAEDVTWVILEPGVYVIRAGVIHVPPVSPAGNIAPMVVLQGTENTTEATEPVIAHPVPVVE